MESEMLQCKIPHQHHDHDHLSSMEKRIEKLFGRFRENFHGELIVENLGPQFGYYGTFLPAQLKGSQAISNGSRENRSSNLVQLKNLPASKSLPCIAKKPAEPVRTAIASKVNNIKIRITKCKRKADVEPEESPSKIRKLMTSCPLSGEAMVSPLKQKLFDLRSVQTVSTDPFLVVEDKILQATKRCTSDKLSPNTERVKINTQFTEVLKPNTQTGIERARSPLMQSELHSTNVTAEEEKLASARPRLKVKIKIGNRSKVEEVHGNGKCPNFCEEPSKPREKEVLKVDAVRRIEKLEDPAARNVVKRDSAVDQDVTESDNWVQCDKCHKWRLLPYWIDPEELTIKWSCSQINWLAPGMNSCKINAHKYTVAVNKIMRHDPSSSKASKHTRTKRASTEILESHSCQKKRKIGDISLTEQGIDLIKIRITNKRRIIRTKRPSMSSWAGFQQISMSTGSSCVLEKSEERELPISTDVFEASTSEKASLLLTEARDFKHRADRLKREGKHILSNALYFEAVLKFLEVASLWEDKAGKDNQASIRLYLETAELCRYCAEQCKVTNNMKAAKLAYEAMELAKEKSACLKSLDRARREYNNLHVNEFIVRARRDEYMFT